jgi:hypothetical protein
LSEIQRRRRSRRIHTTAKADESYDKPVDNGLKMAQSKLNLISPVNWPQIITLNSTPESPKDGGRLTIQAKISGDAQCILWLKVSFMNKEKNSQK